MGRPAPPSDDGSPARLIAAMVGIVGILLLGSLAWSAVGALASAVGAASSALASANPRAVPTLAPAAAVTPVAAASPVVAVSTMTAQVAAATPTPVEVRPTATTPAPATAEPAASPTAVASGRNPWILLPQPEPGAKVPPGSIALEARGRGDAPITTMRLELDGSALPTAIEQRSESTWRGSATARVGSGEHTVRATVTDASGRTGSFRWTFTAAPGP
jgi:hypothetical protein